MKSAETFRRYLDSLFDMLPRDDVIRAQAERLRAEYIETILLIACSSHTQSERQILATEANDSIVGQLHALGPILQYP